MVCVSTAEGSDILVLYVRGAALRLTTKEAESVVALLSYALGTKPDREAVERTRTKIAARYSDIATDCKGIHCET